MKYCMLLLLLSTSICFASDSDDEGKETYDSPTEKNQKLYLAAMDGATNQISPLTAQGANVNAEVWKKQTSLHGAARSDHSDTVQKLIDKGADLNAKESTGMAPIHMAIMHCKDTATLQTLLEGKADVNAKDKDGDTALEIVLKESKNTTKVALLLKYGATTDKPTLQEILKKIMQETTTKGEPKKEDK